MHLIKLDATPSTNLFLKELSSKEELKDFTVVICDHQTSGRGQMGTTWESEPFKNLTFSLLKLDLAISPQQHFQLSMAVSMGIFDCLEALGVPHLKVKWPNDIMSGNAKICGILIENVVKGSNIQKSIIGIGLNVNQTDFGGLLQVSSLKLLLGKEVELESLLERIVEKLQLYFQIIDNGDLKKLYEEHLFKKNEVSSFETNEGIFQGYIQGVDNYGKLIVKMPDEALLTFGFKEVKLIY